MGLLFSGDEPPSVASYIPVQSVDNSVGYGPFSISLAAVTAGNMLIVGTSADGPCTVPTDSKGNTFALAGTGGTIGYVTSIFYARVGSSGADVVTSHCGNVYQGFSISEVPNLQGFDAFASTLGGPGVVSASLTASVGGDFVYTVAPNLQQTNTQSGGAGQTVLLNDYQIMGMLAEWTLAPAPGAFTSSATVNSANVNIAVAAFKVANVTVGKDGDFYIRKTTGRVYGPKSGGSWPSLPLAETPIPARSLDPCDSAHEGYLVPVIDADSVQYWSSFNGGGTCHILAYCDGTSWIVATARAGTCGGDPS
jgi:hypothetical protein